MTDTRMIFDDEFLRRVWDSDIPIPAIAQIYGTSRAAIYRAARRFGMNARNTPVYVHPENPPDSLEAALIWTMGRWSLLNRVAARHGLTSMQVQAAYHRARRNASCPD